MPDEVALQPYMQKLVSDFLRDNLGGTRVVAHPPAEDARDQGWVWVIQTTVEHNADDPADRLPGYLMTFQCYAGKDGGMPEAERLARTVEALLTKRFSGLFSAPTTADDPVVVSAAKVVSGPLSLPDDAAFEPARDRFVLDALIYAHAVNA